MLTLNMKGWYIMNNDQIMGLILALSALFLGTVCKMEAYSKLRESDKDSDKDERERWVWMKLWLLWWEMKMKLVK